MLKRRQFIQCLVAAAAVPAATSRNAFAAGPGPLQSDPKMLLDLPAGFELTVVSRVGDRMSDGLRVPSAHDGMAAFEGGEGRVILVCNHEIGPAKPGLSAFASPFAELPESTRARVYDRGAGGTPGEGGTTTTIYNTETRQTERQFLSLAGTELNCAGGPTPWGSWLSCEECFENAGTSYLAGKKIVRERPHGFVFEVPARGEGLVEPVPLPDMGRFEHEAAAVHEPSGIIYMTEDRYNGLFYRFIPNTPGKLIEGGRLQALVIRDRPSQQTHNWGSSPDILPGVPVAVDWLDLDDVAPSENDLRLRGAKSGAATFARGEGLCDANGDMVFTCTTGGAARLGQVFRYVPSPHEGRDREAKEPATLELIAQSRENSLLRHADNLTMAPWGDLIICEDASAHSGLIGIRPDGSQYPLADNARSNSELAGVCFSPDGQTLFVNIQYPGMTVAITGPWPV